jgi:hypothetical protein
MDSPAGTKKPGRVSANRAKDLPMNYLHAQKVICNQNPIEREHDDASWPAIVALIFDIIAHRDRLALKRKALGRLKRRLARKQRRAAR